VFIVHELSSEWLVRDSVAFPRRALYIDLNIFLKKHVPSVFSPSPAALDIRRAIPYIDHAVQEVQRLLSAWHEYGADGIALYI